MTTTSDTELPRTHILPFGVQTEGPINSQQYFLCNPTANPDQKHATLPTFETVMMGRQMYGYEITVNQDTCQGHVWKKHSEQREEEEDQESWIKSKETAPISKFVLWKKDYAPSDQDPRIKALESWFDISEAIHEPVSLEQQQ